MSQTYEVEIKSLLGKKENATSLIDEIKKKYPDTKLIAKGSQLNHYFISAENLDALEEKLSPFLEEKQKETLNRIVREGKKVSIRTRKTEDKVLFVIKASVGDDTSSNGVKRIEFEAVIPKTLDELDQIILDSGCKYQAKWSREREEYKTKDLNICIDKNAGYGYLAEFEKVTTDEKELDNVKKYILDFMKDFNISELPQDRLERMFAHYNTHWSEYYGTEKTFNIE